MSVDAAPPPADQRLHPWSWLFVLLQQLRQFIVPLLVLLFAGRRQGPASRATWTAGANDDERQMDSFLMSRLRMRTNHFVLAERFPLFGDEDDQWLFVRRFLNALNQRPEKRVEVGDAVHPTRGDALHVVFRVEVADEAWGWIEKRQGGVGVGDVSVAPVFRRRPIRLR